MLLERGNSMKKKIALMLAVVIFAGSMSACGQSKGVNMLVETATGTSNTSVVEPT